MNELRYNASVLLGGSTMKKFDAFDLYDESISKQFCKIVFTESDAVRIGRVVTENRIKPFQVKV